MSQFFISTPIGAEANCLQEMKFFWPLLLGKDARPHVEPFPEVQVHEGGLEFTADVFIALQFNFFLKTANRLLMRLDSFRVRDLPKFYNRLQGLPWKDYLQSGDVEWEISAQKSRLNNEKRLLESAEAALAKIFPQKLRGGFQQKIFIRMFDDLCTISLDSSGEHLHKRGWGVLKGEAPLRETLASFLLNQLKGDAGLEQIQKVHLLDPMTGSGTFLTEARATYFGNFQRAYSFQAWPKGPKLFKMPAFAANYKFSVPETFASFNGIEISEKMTKAAEENWKSLEAILSQTSKGQFKAAPVRWHQADALESPVQMPQPVWMILNPPYGERIASDTFTTGELLEKLCLNYGPSRLGVLLPEKEALKQAPLGYRQIKQIKVNNGGIRCLFRILEKS